MAANTRHRKELDELKQKRKQRILDVAQDLFMTKGLQNVSMMDIAKGSEISRVTLYKYFKSIETIAMEVSVSVQIKVHQCCSEYLMSLEQAPSMSDQKLVLHYHKGMVNRFSELKQCYEFLGAFDHLYSRTYPSSELASYYKRRIDESLEDNLPDYFFKKLSEPAFLRLFISVGNLTLSFLEKLSVRGDLLAEEQGVSIPDQLETFSNILNHSI